MVHQVSVRQWVTIFGPRLRAAALALGVAAGVLALFDPAAAQPRPSPPTTDLTVFLRDNAL